MSVSVAKASMSLQDKLGKDVFKIDTEKPHIVIDHDICRERCSVRPCLYVCPAKLYSLKPGSDDIFVDYEGCLECGTCLIVCQDQALSWQYPRPGFGVQYRFG
jgi:ferredoxin like protein